MHGGLCEFRNAPRIAQRILRNADELPSHGSYAVKKPFRSDLLTVSVASRDADRNDLLTLRVRQVLIVLRNHDNRCHVLLASSGLEVEGTKTQPSHARIRNRLVINAG